MVRPILEMSDAQIVQEIENHLAWQRSGKPYSAANKERLTELQRAHGERDGLNFETSRAAIINAASEGRFISYGDLAEANGVDWNRAYRQIGNHLWMLVQWSHGQGLPMLSAIVVNKQNLASGNMEPETIAGFCRAAEELGYKFDDAVEFLKQQQDAVFCHFRT